MTSSDPRYASSGDLAVGIENAIQSPPAPQIVPNAIPLARRNIQASTMLLAEWIALFHPTATVLFEHRIGPVPQTAIGLRLSPAEIRQLSVRNSYADALLIEAGQLIVVEASVDPDPGKLSQVLYYARLIPQTADLAKYKALPIVPVWLCGLTNPVMAELANELKVQFVVYSPSWIMDYMNRD